MSTQTQAPKYPLVDYVCLYGLSQQRQEQLYTITETYTEPGIEGECLMRYPVEDLERFALPPLLHFFTFPNNITPSKERKSKGREGIEYHSFVMTEENGVKYYGFCATRWNRCKNVKRCYAPMSMVILSHYGFHYSFLSLLSNVLDQVAYNWQTFFSGTMCQHIYQLCSSKFDIITRVHFPVNNSRRTVNFAICDEVVRQPRFVEESGSVVHDATCHYPLCDVDFRILLSNVQMAHLMFLIEAMLTERQIVLHSTNPYKITSVMEALIALIYPFTWPHVYITTLPPTLYHFLEAPVPYLVGTTTAPFTRTFLDKNFLNDDDIIELPKDCITLDLDSQKLRIVNHHMHLMLAQPTCTLPIILSGPLFKNLQIIYNRKANVVLEQPKFNDDLKDMTWNPVHSGPIQLPGTKKVVKPVASARTGTSLSTTDDIDGGEYFQVKYTLRRVFLFAFSKLLRTYRMHLNLPKADDPDTIVDTSTCFDQPSFVTRLIQLHEHKNNDTQPTITFFKRFTNSQLFQYFIQRTVEGGDELALFERYVRFALIKLKEKVTRQEVATLKGWLYKRGQIRKSWKRRWFELNEKGDLRYSTKQYSSPKGGLTIIPNPTNNLNSYRCHRLDKKDNGTIVTEFPTDFPFMLQCGNRQLYVSAESDKDRKLWVGTLRSHMLNTTDRNRLITFIENEIRKENTPSMKRLTTRVSTGKTGSKTFTINNKTIDLDGKTEPFMQFLMYRSNFKVRSSEQKGNPTSTKEKKKQQDDKKRGTSFYFRFSDRQSSDPNLPNQLKNLLPRNSTTVNRDEGANIDSGTEEVPTNTDLELEFYIADEDDITRIDDGYYYANDSLAAQMMRNVLKK
jgi:hypothetical protein